MLCYTVGSSSSGAAGSAGSDKASGAGKEEKKEAEAEQQLRNHGTLFVKRLTVHSPPCSPTVPLAICALVS